MRFLLFLLLLSSALAAQLQPLPVTPAIADSFVVADTAFTGLLYGISNPLLDGYDADSVAIDDQYLDAAGRLYAITEIADRRLNTLRGTLAPLDSSGTKPSGRGVLFRPDTLGLIPVVSDANGLISQGLQAKIQNHNLRVLRARADSDDQQLSINGRVISLDNSLDITLPPDNVVDGDPDPTNERQFLAYSFGQLNISDGNTVTIPDEVDDADADPANEIQTLTISGGFLTLSNGGTVEIPDDEFISSSTATPINFDYHDPSLRVYGVGFLLRPSNVNSPDIEDYYYSMFMGSGGSGAFLLWPMRSFGSQTGIAHICSYNVNNDTYTGWEPINTDDQQLSISGDQLTLERGGPTITLPTNTGPAGADGQAATITVGDVVTGAPGSAVEVEEDGTATNRVLNFTIPSGLPGQDGADGDTGADGADGSPGANGLGWTSGSYNTSTGLVTFNSTDGLGFATGDLRGATGTNGEDGTNGQDGTNGEDGRGIASTVISSGVITFTFTDGSTYSTPDLRGQDGANGAAGADGQDGTDGVSIVSTTESNGQVTFTYSNGGTFTTSDLRGAPGADGQDGADSTVPGPVGPAGPEASDNEFVVEVPATVGNVSYSDPAYRQTGVKFLFRPSNVDAPPVEAYYYNMFMGGGSGVQVLWPMDAIGTARPTPYFRGYSAGQDNYTGWRSLSPWEGNIDQYVQRGNNYAAPNQFTTLRLKVGDNPDPITNGNLAEYFSGTTQRSTLRDNGHQSWFLAAGSGDLAGTLGYTTPSGNPGMVFRNALGNARTQIYLHTQSGGIAFGTGSSAGNPGADVIISEDGFLGIRGATPLYDLDVGGPGAIRISRGSTAQRPNPVKALLRFNSETDKFEGYDGDEWIDMAGLYGGTGTIPTSTRASFRPTLNSLIGDGIMEFGVFYNGVYNTRQKAVDRLDYGIDVHTEISTSNNLVGAKITIGDRSQFSKMNYTGMGISTTPSVDGYPYRAIQLGGGQRRSYYGGGVNDWYNFMAASGPVEDGSQLVTGTNRETVFEPGFTYVRDIENDHNVQISFPTPNYFPILVGTFPVESGKRYEFKMIVYYSMNSGGSAPSIRMGAINTSVNGRYVVGIDGITSTLNSATEIAMPTSFNAETRMVVTGRFQATGNGFVIPEIKTTSTVNVKYGTLVEYRIIN